MGQTEQKSIIHRMAQVARDGYDARAMTPSKALRLSLAKTADRLFELPLVITTVEQQTLPVRDVRAMPGEDGLIVLLDGKKGRRGALVLDFQILAAVIEVQTLGSVRRNAAESRPVTRTDAAMAAPLIDALMEGFDAQMSGGLSEYEPLELGFGDRMADMRSLCLALDAPAYELFQISVDIADGAKAGVLSALLPVVPRPNGTAKGKDMTGGRPPVLEDSAMNAPVILDAVIARLRLPLHQVCALKPGTELEFGVEKLEKTQLLGAEGHVVTEVRLGQLGGWRAVRILTGDDKEPTPETDRIKHGVPGDNAANGAETGNSQNQDDPIEAVAMPEALHDDGALNSDNSARSLTVNLDDESLPGGGMMPSGP